MTNCNMAERKHVILAWSDASVATSLDRQNIFVLIGDKPASRKSTFLGTATHGYASQVFTAVPIVTITA